jgi:hypothetical protein
MAHPAFMFVLPGKNGRVGELPHSKSPGMGAFGAWHRLCRSLAE